LRKVKTMSTSEQPEQGATREPNEDEGGRRLRYPSDDAREIPLFLRDKSDGQKGNAQDEKDEVGE
jgi:hypothetical protein